MVNFLQHKHHKFSITFLVFFLAAIGIAFGIRSYGAEYLRYNVEIVTVTLQFVNTGLLLVIVSLIIKIGAKS